MHSADFSPGDLPDYQRRVYFRWRAACRGESLPLMEDFDFMSQDSTSGALILTEIIRDDSGMPIDFLPIYMGTSMTQGTGRHMLGKCLSVTPGKGPGSMIWAVYQTLARQGKPLLVSLPFVGKAPGVQSTCEVILPLRGAFPDEAGYALAALQFLPHEANAGQAVKALGG